MTPKATGVDEYATDNLKRSQAAPGRPAHAGCSHAPAPRAICAEADAHARRTTLRAAPSRVAHQQPTTLPQEIHQDHRATPYPSCRVILRDTLSLKQTLFFSKRTFIFIRLVIKHIH